MRLTKHAKARLRQRGGTHDDVITTVNTGVRLINRTDPNKYTFVNNSTGMYVVTNSEVTVVITIFWKGQQYVPIYITLCRCRYLYPMVLFLLYEDRSQ